MNFTDKILMMVFRKIFSQNWKLFLFADEEWVMWLRSTSIASSDILKVDGKSEDPPGVCGIDSRWCICCMCNAAFTLITQNQISSNFYH
jgi:hypothetical protein